MAAALKSQSRIRELRVSENITVNVLRQVVQSYQVIMNSSRDFRCGRTTCDQAKGAGTKHKYVFIFGGAGR